MEAIIKFSEELKSVSDEEWKRREDEMNPEYLKAVKNTYAKYLILFKELGIKNKDLDIKEKEVYILKMLKELALEQRENKILYN